MGMSADTPENGLPAAQQRPSGATSHTGSERRRSARVDLRVPVLIACSGVREACWTVSVSENGALVTASRPLESGQRITLLNVATGRSTAAEVIAPLLPSAQGGASDVPGGAFRLAIRLDEPDATFWGPAYSRLRRQS